MGYSIRTKDGITINNIPDDIAPDSDVLRQRVAAERAKRDQSPFDNPALGGPAAPPPPPPPPRTMKQVFGGALATGVETLGMLGGGVAGAAGGPVGAIAGAGLGYSGAKRLTDLGRYYLDDQPLPQGVAENAYATAKDFGMGAAMELGGQAVAPAIGPVLGVAGRAARGVRDWFPGGMSIADKALTNTIGKGSAALGAAKNALIATKDMITSPGTSGTLSERLVEGGVRNPTLARVERAMAIASPKMNRAVLKDTEERIGALVSQLDRIEKQIASEGVLQPGVKADLNAVRKSIVDRLDAETATLTKRAQGAGDKLYEGSPVAPGQVLQDRARTMKAEQRAKEITPAYEAAFKEAGDTQVGIEGVITKAEEITGQPLSTYAAESAPFDTIRKLAMLRPKAGVDGAAAEPVTMNLRELDQLRKAINSDMAKAKNSPELLSPTQMKNLGDLHRAIDEAVTNSTLSAEAKDLYSTALTKYRTEFAPRWREGETAKLLQGSTYGRTRLRPGDAVSKFLSKPENAQEFVTSYGKDPEAVAAMTSGIQGLFRKAVIDPVTKMVKPDAATKFLEANRHSLDVLKKSGINVEASFKGIAEEATRHRAGLDEVARLTRTLVKDDPTAMVDGIIKSPTVMKSSLSKLSPEGRAALNREVMDRSTAGINKGDPEAAIKYLTDNAEAISLSVGKKAHADLLDLARFQKEVKAASTDLERQGAGVKPAINNMIDGFTPEQLTSLKSLTDDLRRMKEVGDLAAWGGRVNSPVMAKIGQETAEASGVTPEMLPGYLSLWATTARKAWKELAIPMNRRTAAKLYSVIYRDPDAAIPILEKAMKRAVARETSLNPVGAAAAKVGGINAFAPDQRSRNAYAE